MYTHIYSNSSPSIMPAMDDDNISEVDSVLYTPTSPKNHHHHPHSWYSSPYSSIQLRKHKSIDFTINNNNSNNNNNKRHSSSSTNISIEDYQSTFERMDHHINEFLNNKKNNNIENTKTYMSTTILIDHLKEFRDTIPSQFNITQPDTDYGIQLLDTFLSWYHEQQDQQQQQQQQSLTTSLSSSSSSLLEQAQLCFPLDIFLSPSLPNKEKEQEKEKRFLHTIHTLVKKNHQLKQQLKQQQQQEEKKRKKKEEKEKKDDHEKQEDKILLLEKKLKLEQQLKEEAEEMVESVNIEMESMMDELDQAKQKNFIYQKEIDQLRQQWQTTLQYQKEQHEKEEETNKEDATSTMKEDTTQKEKEKEKEKKKEKKKKEFTPWELLTLQEKDWEYRVETLTSMLQQQEQKTKQLQTKLKTHKQQHQLEIASYQATMTQQERQLAEMDVQYHLLKQQVKEKETIYQQQRDSFKRGEQQRKKRKEHLEKEQEAIIHALQQDIKEKETLLVNWEKKWHHHQQQLSFQRERQEKEMCQYREACGIELQQQVDKEKALFELECARQVRVLEAHVVDLEQELAMITENQQALIQYHHRLDHLAKQRESSFSLKQKKWEEQEKQNKGIILSLEQKIIGLEEEVIKLYGKNIVLANQLGECD